MNKNILPLITSVFVLSALYAAPVLKDYPMIRDIRNMRGVIIFVNAQNRVRINGGLTKAVTALDREFHWDIRTTNVVESVSFKSAIAIRKSLKATSAVFFVDSEDLPSLTANPDEGVAFVNVACLSQNNPTERRLERRIYAESLRAFAFAFGVGFSQYKSALMNPAKSLAELDIIPGKSFYPYDTLVTLRTVAESLGMSPYVEEYYETACINGWAPAPTNAIQQAIWDKVRAVPKNPMKIEFDPKKGR